MTDRPRNIDTALAAFDELWSPRILTRVNDWDVRLAKVRGEHLWHAHHDTDEFFLVLDGSLDIDLREPGAAPRRVTLCRNDTYVVPRGVDHRPSSTEGATLLLFEPAGTLTTGDYAGEVPAHITATIGTALT
ncbi:cupin domain-containing protein [Nocardia neocaledoniensis]|jgi:mannose-6-phosphate isomerase-like protein (cupin superfamily)|uniref:cupin domain-containing protein n=1 Tax=Nocardia neocaledoniensis TaxID=236511 RepID=UPI0033EDB1E4